MGIQINGQTDTISAVDNNFSLAGNVSIGGTLTYEDVTSVDAVGLSTFKAGIQLDDSITHLGDTDTKIRFPANDTFTVETAGSERLRITSAGLVGIGSAIPAQALDILNANPAIRLTDTDPSGVFSQIDGAGGDLILTADGGAGSSNSFISFRVDGNDVNAEKLRITSDGSLGINEATPDSKLDIVYHTSENSATANLIHLRADPSGSYASRGLFVKVGRDGAYDNSGIHYDVVGSAGNSGFHAFEVQGSEKLRITSGGNVNIGGEYGQTDSKVTIVDASRPIAEATLNLQSSATSGAQDTGPVLRFYGHSGSEGRYHASIKGAKENGTSGNTAGYLAFNTRPAGGAMAERVRITSDGYARLTTANARLEWTASSGSNPFIRSIGSGQQELEFNTGGTERLRITSGGEVIVNGTATGSNAKFEVQSTTGSISSATLRVTAEKTTTGAINTGSSILLAGHDGGNSRDFASLFAGKENGTGSNYAAYLAFGTRSNGSGLAERLRIDSTGDLIQASGSSFWQKNGNTLFLISSGQSTPTVYVSDSGNDSTGDGTSSNPYRTLSTAWYHIPRVYSHNHAPRILIKGTSYTVDTTHYCRGGGAGGNWQYGPAIDIKSESGSQIDVYLRSTLLFESVDGLRFQNINFICDASGGHLSFTNCQRGKIYPSCDMNVTATGGWSYRIQYIDSTFRDEMDIAVASTASSGLGAIVILYNSSCDGSRSITKAGSQFGNAAVAVVNGSFFGGQWNVNNFNTGIRFGINHYGAETGGVAMLNGVTISNCSYGLDLYNNSFVRKYSTTYTSNSTNERSQTGSFIN